jgi:cell division transport system ATP-binding protein
VLHFTHVSKRYPGRGEVLGDLNFSIAEGELVFLTGRSGAGKTTILRLSALIERATRGQILFDGEDLSRIHDRKIPYLRRKFGLIFQDYRLLMDHSVHDNVALPLVIAGYPAREIGSRVRAALDQVGLLDKENVYPMILSGGEQQRVGIARAVVHKPKMILADEPTGNLDPELSSEIMALFERFRQVGSTVMVASHDLELIAKMKSRVLRLENGSIVEDIS